MPLSHEIDENRLLVAVGSGLISAFFHWASVRTSDKPVSIRVMQGQMIASFASGVISTQLLGMQTMFKVDPLGAFCVAAIIGFVYGPAGLVVAARTLAKKFGLEPPPEAPSKPVEAPPAPAPSPSAPPTASKPGEGQ